MVHMHARKLDNLLILLKFHIANRTQVRLFIFLVIFYSWKSWKLLLIQARVFIRVCTSGEHFNKLYKSWGVCAVWSYNEVRPSVWWEPDNLVGWPSSGLVDIIERTAPEKGVTKNVHERAGIVHVSVSLIKNYRLAFFLIRAELFLSTSHSVSASAVPLNVDWIFLAYVNVIVHKRSGVLYSTEIALYLSMFTFVRMGVKLGKSLTIPTEWTGNSLLSFRIFRCLLIDCNLLSDVCFRKRVWLSSGLENTLFFRLIVKRWFLFLRVLGNATWPELGHALTSAFVN